MVGLGRIGSAVAVRVKAFGFNILFYDPFKDDGYDKTFGITRCDNLEDFFTHSDCTSLHCNCTLENVNMVNSTWIAKIPAGAMLENTARGELVDEVNEGTIVILKLNNLYPMYIKKIIYINRMIWGLT